MGLLQKIFSNLNNSQSSITNSALQSYLGNGSDLSEEDVMQIPAAQAAVELITSTVGQLPIRMYRLDSERMPIEIDDERLFILNQETNESLDGYSFKKKVSKDYLLYGASKSKIKYATQDSNQVKAIYPLDTNNINIEVTTSDGVDRHGRVILNTLGKRYTFNDDDLLSVLRDTNNGVTGIGVLDNNSYVFHLALNQLDYENNLLKNSGTPNGVIELPTNVTSKVLKSLAEGWHSSYEGTSNAGKTPILTDGASYKQISSSPDKLQLDSSKKTTLSDIARVFNLPESLINANANKYNSNEQNSMYFIQNCLGPILRGIENALNKTLLTYTEKKNNYYFKFDTDEIVNSTLQDTADAASTMYNNGIISLKEARRRVGYNNISDQDFIKFSQGNVLYNPSNGNMSILNKGETTDDDNIETISSEHEDSLENDDNSKEGNENNNGKNT